MQFLIIDQNGSVLARHLAGCSTCHLRIRQQAIIFQTVVQVLGVWSEVEIAAIPW
jgi:hypothetical protein